jgi:hypothetical protein
LQAVISGAAFAHVGALACSHPRETEEATEAATMSRGRIASSYPAANSMTPAAVNRK